MSRRSAHSRCGGRWCILHFERLVDDELRYDDGLNVVFLFDLFDLGTYLGLFTLLFDALEGQGGRDADDLDDVLYDDFKVGQDRIEYDFE